MPEATLLSQLLTRWKTRGGCENYEHTLKGKLETTYTDRNCNCNPSERLAVVGSLVHVRRLALDFCGHRDRRGNAEHPKERGGRRHRDSVGSGGNRDVGEGVRAGQGNVFERVVRHGRGRNGGGLAIFAAIEVRILVLNEQGGRGVLEVRVRVLTRGVVDASAERAEEPFFFDGAANLGRGAANVGDGNFPRSNGRPFAERVSLASSATGAGQKTLTSSPRTGGPWHP